MVETLLYEYTSQDEIERLIGLNAAQNFSDDDGDGAAEEGVWADITTQATDEVNIYCEQWYDPSDMVNNLWVRRQATLIGAYYLSQRGADPGFYHARYEATIKILEQISEGRKQIPRLPTRANMSPSVANYRIDDRYPVRKTRVQTEISTPASSTTAETDVAAYYYEGWI